ncbi:catalase, partial [Clostridium botulinum]|nr:catalase [Clostridium botulinum]
GKNHYILHKETRELLEFLLNKLVDDGEELTLHYIKNNLLKDKATF